MKRLLFLLAVLSALIPVPASAQFANGTPFGWIGGFFTAKRATGASYTGPGDILSFTDWWGVRAYSAAIASAGTQKLINVLATGTTPANVTCDIIVATSGGMGNTANCSTGSYNGTAAATFCATGSGSCVIETWYDQVGSNNISTCSSVALNFTVMGTNTKPAGTSDGVSGHNCHSTITLTLAQPFIISAVAESNAPTALGGITANSVNIWLGLHDGANLLYMAAGGTSQTITASDSVPHAIQAVYHTTTSLANVDGTETNTGATVGTTGFSNGTQYILDDGLGDTLKGYVSEVGIFSGASDSTHRNNLCHNQRLYYGTTGSC